MKRNTILAGLVLIAAAHAQTSYHVVPTKYGTTRGNAYNYFTFYTRYVPHRAQWIYNASDIKKPTLRIKGISFRRTCATGNTCPLATATVEVKVTTGPNTASTASSRFAANHGSNVVTAFPSGKINMPRSPWVNTGIPPYLVTIPFSTPFIYIASTGKSLVLDLRVTAYNPTSSTGQWWLDAVKREYGKWKYVLIGFPNKQCVYSNKRVSAGGGSLSAGLYPGGYFTFTQSGMPPNLPGIFWLGAAGPGQKWGPFPLPLSLAPMGAGTCQIGASIDVVGTCNTDATGKWTWPRVNIPNDQRLVNSTVYEQGLFLDKGANAANLVTTFVMAWPIGSGIQPEGAEVYRRNDTGNSPTGVFRREVPIVRLSY